MVQDKNVEIPESVMIYLNEISERMKQGRAVVMVGSGFSKNANPCRSTEKKFLDWGQLGDIFYKKLYGKLPCEEKNPYFYQDILKLADRVEQCFGRTVLDKLLLDNLPDEEYEPSKLHEMLLTLNWTDIFTTNYDTLLERTRARVFHKRYQLVLNKDDLVYSKCPRIIKLHGSFPSTRPFIVTEEDYRRYPKESAIFVNTVQQSLIENVMCMIGFSGEDPNFLNWIGWIRDNLGESTASKIYLVGVFDLHETERKLFQSRNIVLVNMKDCPDINSGDHKKGIELFFKKLLEMQNEEEQKVWESVKGKTEETLISIIHDCKLQNITHGELLNFLKAIASDWKIEREIYPGWIVAPYDRRERLVTSVKYGGVLIEELISGMKKIPREIMGNFLYEFDWKRRTCLSSLTEKWVEAYKMHLDMKLEAGNGLSFEDCCLGLEILRFEHQVGDWNEWEKYETILNQEIQIEQLRQRLDLERSCQEFYKLEFGVLSRTLVKLNEFDVMSEEAFTYAALLTEMGYIDKAINYMKSNLNTVRMQIGDSIDYQIYSAETYYMTLLEYLEKYQNYQAVYQEPTEKEGIQDYSHLRTLWGYECNPQYESDYLVRSIVAGDNENYSIVENSEPEKFMNFLNRIGMTFRSSYLVDYVDKLPVIIRGMLSTNPYRAFICTIRLADVSACQIIWNRRTCEVLDVAQAENIAEACIRSCVQNREYILQIGSEKQNSNLAIYLPEIVPIILAGIVYKVNIGTKRKILAFLEKAIKDKEINFTNIVQLLRETVNSIKQDELCDIWKDIIEFPIGIRVQQTEKKNILFEPSVYMDLSQRMTLDGSVLKQIQSKATELLNSPQSNMDEKLAIYLRLFVFGYMNGNDTILKNAAIELEYFFKANEESVRRQYCCYLIDYRFTDRINEVKADYLLRLFNQIRSFDINENNHCLELYSTMNDLRKELNYYYYEKKEGCPIWSNEELMSVIQEVLNWNRKLKSYHNNRKNTELCFSYWLLLDEIIMLIFLHRQEGGDTIELDQKIHLLNEVLQEFFFPFTARILYEKNMIVDNETRNMLLKRIAKGNKEYQETAMIIRKLKESVTEKNENIELLWDIVNEA